MAVGRWLGIALCSSAIAAWVWLATPAPSLACTADVGQVQVAPSLVLRNSVIARMVALRRDPATGYVNEVTLDIERVLRGDWPSGRITTEMDSCHPTLGPAGHRLAIATMRTDRLSAYYAWTWDLDVRPYVQLMDPYDASYGFDAEMTEADLVRFLETGLPDTATRGVPDTATHGFPAAAPGPLALLLSAAGGIGLWTYRLDRRRRAR
jgi:hypothetical protein